MSQTQTQSHPLVDDRLPQGVVAIDWSSRPRSVFWDSAANTLQMIDQRDLPLRHDVVSHTSVQQVIDSIKSMLVRGAPAIGAAGAFAMVIAAQHSQATNTKQLLDDLTAAKGALDASRPTAVNLSWATGRLLELATLLVGSHVELQAIKDCLLLEAQQLADDDIQINKRIGDYGCALLPAKSPLNLLHHCNTGCLATVDYGTALGVIYSAHHQGKKPHVWVDETRPRLQGSKLTAWELMREGVDLHLVPDNAAGLLMLNGKVDAVVFGADRVAANGDTANKIGTYKVAVVARENNVPTYACVPTSTIDLTVVHGKDIVIEERHADEVVLVGETRIAPLNCPVFNPAFDVTPAKYITAIVTEEGVCYPPFEQSLPIVKRRAEERVREEWKKRLEVYLKK